MCGVDVLALDGDEDCQDVVHGGDEPLRITGEAAERKLRIIGDPRMPTQREVDDHYLTHLPYRNWCSICVRAKGKDMDHRSAVEKERGLSEYCFDYCFPGDELG